MLPGPGKAITLYLLLYKISGILSDSAGRIFKVFLLLVPESTPTVNEGGASDACWERGALASREEFVTSVPGPQLSSFLW